MKVRALLFVIFTVCLFALGVLVTTLFNTAPATNDAVAMFYGSLSITLFGLIFFLLIAFTRIQTHVNPGLGALKVMLRASLIIDILVVALLALKANNVLNWATSIVLVLVAIIIGIILKKRAKQ